jgi:hypothetical protein
VGLSFQERHTVKGHPHESEPKDSEQPKNRKREQGDEIREENLDKTIADSFPASDPPSSIPDPEEEEDAA